MRVSELPMPITWDYVCFTPVALLRFETGGGDNETWKKNWCLFSMLQYVAVQNPTASLNALSYVVPRSHFDITCTATIFLVIGIVSAVDDELSC